MKRWKFFGLIGLMLVSLLGIIWVQLIWIQNAINVRNDLFNRSVYQSLQTTARRIESSRNMEFLRRMMATDSMLQAQASTMMANPFYGGTGGGEEYLNAATVPDNFFGFRESFSVQVTENGEQIILSGDVRATVSGDTMIYIPARPREEFSIPVNEAGNMLIREDQFQSWLRRKSAELRNMGDKLINELYELELNTGANRALIEKALTEELSNSGINTPFEFAVIEDDRIIDGGINKSEAVDLLMSNYTVRLFPDRLIRNNTRLSLVFPERKSYIIGSMALILGASSLFSIIILITFALSIFFIIRQKKVSEMKSDFINNMTHEFKTPIATISLAADTISNPRIIGDENQVRHFIGMIKKENVRMNKQVENILQMSTLDKSEMEFSFEELNINSIIQLSIDTILIQVEGKGGNIYFYPEADKPVIEGDPEHLTNLVHNLLDNANKYSPTDPEITIRTQSVKNYLKITVEDKGMGMTKAVQSKIFERFYREAGGNIHNVKGFGLGLNYVKAIVEAHNGRIEVASEAGKGSRFDVYLPQ
ncbi:MAG: HAMP domain-containing sensor histidine kinase [Marinilabiliaceae bacterium]|jgi:two-component system phosphate regulon sensor histidine kinase PhoR|nr:HAMP domain-containing sensor histidine kinase [Marinilabiliaceae bacterium]